MTFINRFATTVKRLSGNNELSRGAAYITFMIFGWLGLREFAQVRYDIQKRRGRSLEMEEEMKKLGIKQKSYKSIEQIYEETVETQDLNDWYNIRGPRVGEDSKKIQDKQRQKIKLQQNLNSKQSFT